MGWALREYTKVDERAVIAFVKEHEAELSGLSRREALMWLERRRRRTGS
ncbi:MAG TPA: DNA alkylation repair protein [Acidimicrobiales bacterium]